MNLKKLRREKWRAVNPQFHSGMDFDDKIYRVLQEDVSSDNSRNDHCISENPTIQSGSSIGLSHTKKLDCRYRTACDMLTCSGCVSISRGLK